MRIQFLSLLAASVAGLPSCTSTGGSTGLHGGSGDPIDLRQPATIDRQPAAARFEPGLESRGNNGPWEMTLGGAGSSNDSLDAGAVQATGSAGYYFNECVELSVRQNSAYSDAGPSSSSSWSSTSRAALDFHIPLGNFVPYVGANLGYVYGDGVNDSLTAGPEAGVKVYVKSDVFVLAAVEYQYFFDSDDSLNNAFDDGQFVYGLSLGVRF